MLEYSEMHFNGATARIACFAGDRREVHAVIMPDDSEADGVRQIKAISVAAARLAKETCCTPLFERYCLSDATNQAPYLPSVERCARSVVQQPPLASGKAVMLIIMREGSSVQKISDGVWKDSDGKIWVGDIAEVHPSDTRTMTVRYLDYINEVLHREKSSLYGSCLRTWFFVRDIDNNYPGVVKGRNEVFQRLGLTSGTHFIASTGIAGQSPMSSRLVAFNAIADPSVAPSQIKYLQGRTHLNPTYEYGVAFERGTSVDYIDRRHVYISGTASIDNKGEIVAPGDVIAQTERMLSNIEVLLSEAGAGWSDVAHMIVYLRDIADHSRVNSIISSRFAQIPTAIVLAPVCRAGWLVEAECFAITAPATPGMP